MRGNINQTLYYEYIKENSNRPGGDHRHPVNPGPIHSKEL